MKTEESVRQAIESLRENVKTILESESKDYNAKLTEMAKSFVYLQQLNKDVKIPEYEEAKQLIESIGTKDQQFAEYFKKFVN